MERIQVNDLTDAELWPIVILNSQERAQVSGVSIAYSMGCFIDYSGTSKTSYTHLSICLNGASVAAYIIFSEKRSSSVLAMINGGNRKYVKHKDGALGLYLDLKRSYHKRCTCALVALYNRFFKRFI